MSNIIKIKNGIRYDMNGWVYVSIKGGPFERGYAYGKLIEKDMKQVKTILDFMILNDYGVPWDFFVKACEKYFSPKIKEQFFCHRSFTYPFSKNDHNKWPNSLFSSLAL